MPQGRERTHLSLCNPGKQDLTVSKEKVFEDIFVSVNESVVTFSRTQCLNLVSHSKKINK